MRYNLLRSILKNKNIKGIVIGEIKFTHNIIVLNEDKLEIVSKRTNNFLAYTNIEQLIKYDTKIKYYVNNEFLYYLLNIEKFNRYNSSIEATI